MYKSYVVLFPTGLMMIIGSNPFNVQSKITLNLKKEEYIIDYSY